MKKRLLVIIGIFILILTLSPLFFYVYFFFYPEFSKDFNDWQAFSQYVGGTVGTIVSGFGFIAIAYTIYLQIASRNDQRRQDRFNLFLKLVDDLKHDLNNFERGSHKGLFVWNLIEMTMTSLNVKSFEPVFSYLFTINQQIDDLFGMFEKEKLLSESEIDLIRTKTISLYISNLSSLYIELGQPKFNFLDLENSIFRQSCIDTKKIIGEYLGVK